MKRAILTLTIVLSLLLAACSSTPSSAPRDTVRGFFDAMKTGDLETAEKYVATENNDFKNELSMDEDGLSDEILKNIFSHLAYDIKSEKTDGDQAFLDTAVTSLDLIQVITQVMEDVIPEALSSISFDEENGDDIDAMVGQFLSDAISNPEAPTIVTDVKISLERIDGQWLINPDDDLLSAMIGNVDDAF